MATLSTLLVELGLNQDALPERGTWITRSGRRGVKAAITFSAQPESVMVVKPVGDGIRCETCRYWWRDRKVATMGTCIAVTSDDPEATAWLVKPSGKSGHLETFQNHACAMWEGES